MIQAGFAFIGELNDFLSSDYRGITVSLKFDDHQTVKHLFESLGVPHTEVSHVLADSCKVDNSYHPHTGELIEVFPYSPENRRPVPIGDELHFALDLHLGKLARYMRLLGFDSAYRNDYNDLELAEISQNEGRVLLTRDRRLLMRKQVEWGCCLRSLDPRQQLLEVLHHYDLLTRVSPFQRCPRCNTMQLPISKETILDRLEPLTKRYYDEFSICPNCQQIYWKGSHYERMLQWIHQELLGSAQDHHERALEI
jgi:uncharacterized protein